jgi:hypothetical protein
MCVSDLVDIVRIFGLWVIETLDTCSGCVEVASDNVEVVDLGSSKE